MNHLGGRRLHSRFTPTVARRGQFNSQRTEEGRVPEGLIYQLVISFGHCTLVGIVTEMLFPMPRV
jgi:hypothetical protein